MEDVIASVKSLRLIHGIFRIKIDKFLIEFLARFSNRGFSSNLNSCQNPKFRKRKKLQSAPIDMNDKCILQIVLSINTC